MNDQGTSKNGMIKYDGQSYYDDRLFVIYLCKGKVEVAPDGIIVTTIYHEQTPDDYVWCVVTYRNCGRYPLHSVISFYKKDDAIKYISNIEPETPLISLDGKSPASVVPYDEYVSWKQRNNFKEYDWKSLYIAGGTNASERIMQMKEQFKGIQ